MNPQSAPTGYRRELTVGEVAKRSGVAVSTLHFYESKGLIQSWRTTGNQRRYAREVLRRVALIKVAQRTGISLAEIRKALKSLPHGALLSPTVLRALLVCAISSTAASAAAASRSASAHSAIRGTSLASKARGPVFSILTETSCTLLHSCANSYRLQFICSKINSGTRP